MANIFRNFQVSRAVSNSSVNLEGDPDADKTGSYSIKEFVRSPIRLLSHHRSPSIHFTKKGADSDDEGAHGDYRRDNSRPLKRDQKRRGTQKASQAVKDGVSALRTRLRKITHRGSAFHDAPDPPSPTLKMCRGTSSSSVGSKSSREGSSKTDADLFRAEVTKLERVQAFTEFLWERVGGNVEEVVDKEVHQILDKWNRTIEGLIPEAWCIAESICKAQRRKADFVMEQGREAQKRSREAHTAYMKEITGLRDQVRNLEGAREEGLRCHYFSALGQHDAATRDLVLACTEERVKELFMEADREDSVIGLEIASRVHDKRGEIRKEEQRRMESIFQSEREELQRRISQLQNEAELLKVDMDEAKLDLTGKDLESKKAEEELHRSARKSMAEATQLREDLEQARLEIKSLTERVELASQEASDARQTLAAERAARIATAGQLGQAERALGERAVRAETLLSLARLESTELVVQDMDADQPKASSASQESVETKASESRPILPGATATLLMEHAAQLHESLDVQKPSSSVVSATDLLTVLERLGHQLEIEVRQEATDVLPEAFEGSLVITLLTAHAQMARSYGSALLPLALLLMKSIGELCSLAQGKGTHQMKVSALSRQLTDIRSEAQRLLSASFSCAQSGFEGLESLRKRLRSSLQPDDRGAGPVWTSSASSDESIREERTQTAPELGSSRSFTGVNAAQKKSPSIGGKATPKSASNKAKGRQSNGVISMCDTLEPALRSTLSAVTPKAAVAKGGHHNNKRTSSVGSMGSNKEPASPGDVQRVFSDGLSVSSVVPTPKSAAAAPVTPQMSESVLVTNPSQQSGHSGLLQKRPNFMGRRKST